MPWFRRPVDGFEVLVPDYLVDTIERCRRESWAEIPDPRIPVAQPESDHFNDEVKLVDADPAATRARHDAAKVEQAKAVKARNASARKWVERKA